VARNFKLFNRPAFYYALSNHAASILRRFLLKPIVNMQASCYALSTGFLQNDRGVVDYLLQPFSGHSMTHSIGLHFIMLLPVLLQASCEDFC